jgi:hypothetical protein
MNITRRTTLSLLGSALATPALGQSLRRIPLPEWIQATRISGLDWQNKIGRTIFMSKPSKRIMLVQWEVKSGLVKSLNFLPDPSLTLSEKIFRLYEVRGKEEFKKNPNQIEDVIWPGTRSLVENIWTSFSTKTDIHWDELYNPGNIELIPINLPRGTLVMYIQPTNDTPLAEETVDLDLSTEGTLQSIISQMISQNTHISPVSLDMKILKELNLPNKQNYLASLPLQNMPLYTHVYFRFLTL